MSLGMTLDDYLDAALARAGLTSDRELSRWLGLGAPTVCQYRTRRALPSDTAMLRIADLAGADQAVALVNLAMWRNAAHPEARRVFSDIRDRLEGIKRAS